MKDFKIDLDKLTSKPEPIKRAQFNIQLPHALLEEFTAFCKQHELSRSELIRRLIQLAVNS